jgi:Trypsin-like peptidase domain
MVGMTAYDYKFGRAIRKADIVSCLLVPHLRCSLNPSPFRRAAWRLQRGKVKMVLRASLLIVILVVQVFILSPDVLAQDTNNLKSGVVRIQNTKLNEVGSGFIVRVNSNDVYVVTASHVVTGEQHPSVYLFNRQHDPLPASVIDREEDDTKGLALLLLKVPREMAPRVAALKISNTSELSGGEDVKIIGFPDGTTFWTVSSGSIARVEGRSLVFSGAIRGGNSGGPVILNGQVIGMVTDVEPTLAYADRGEDIVTYVNGIESNLIDTKSSGRDVSVEGDNEFCQTLTKLLEASKSDFYSIVGDPSFFPNNFIPKVMLPGAKGGYVVPKERVYNYLFIDKDKSKVESQFYAVVTKVRACLPKWEEKESTFSSQRYHKFRENNGTPVVNVYFDLDAFQGDYTLTLSVDALGHGLGFW